MRFFVLMSVLGVLGSVGCASTPEPREEARVEPAEAEPAAVYVSPTTQGTIARADLLPVLDAGFGAFLGGVGTEPDLQEGQFVGFRITRLYPEDVRFTSLDLKPGDTVVAVNARPIERPEQALQTWNELRVASAIVVDYLRDGEPRQLRFEILD